MLGAIVAFLPLAVLARSFAGRLMLAAPLILAEFPALAPCLPHWLAGRRGLAAREAGWWSVNPLRARRPE